LQRLECRGRVRSRPIHMEIIVNGDRREVPDGLTVASLLEFLQMRANRVAIERNREILLRAQWQATQVQPNDSFEIVQFVGGG
jgi:thiamine biosynthesis protein ThiS